MSRGKSSFTISNENSLLNQTDHYCSLLVGSICPSAVAMHALGRPGYWSTALRRDL